MRNKDRRRVCLPADQWPYSEREAWYRAIRLGAFLEPGGKLSHLRAASHKKLERGFGRYLTFLTEQAVPGDGQVVEVTTREIVADYVKELQLFGNSAMTITNRLTELSTVLGALHPDREVGFIRDMPRTLAGRRIPSRDKDNSIRSVDALLDLGLSLMRVAPDKTSDMKRAMRYRDGLLIAFLAMRPLRRKNLASIEIGRNLIWESGDRAILSFEAQEMKNGSSFEVSWPPSLLDNLKHYLEFERPVLCSQKLRWAKDVGNRLWVSAHGSPMTQTAIYDRIVRLTRERFGKPLSPHLFRDAFATHVAIYDPQAVGICAPVLSHRSFQTTERYYLRARQAEAVGKFHEALLALRKSDGTRKA